MKLSAWGRMKIRLSHWSGVHLFLRWKLRPRINAIGQPPHVPWWKRAGRGAVKPFALLWRLFLWMWQPKRMSRAGLAIAAGGVKLLTKARVPKLEGRFVLVATLVQVWIIFLVGPILYLCAKFTGLSAISSANVTVGTLLIGFVWRLIGGINVAAKEPGLIEAGAKAGGWTKFQDRYQVVWIGFLRMLGFMVMLLLIEYMCSVTGWRWWETLYTSTKVFRSINIVILLTLTLLSVDSWRIQKAKSESKTLVTSGAYRKGLWIAFGLAMTETVCMALPGFGVYVGHTRIDAIAHGDWSPVPNRPGYYRILVKKGVPSPKVESANVSADQAPGRLIQFDSGEVLDWPSGTRLDAPPGNQWKRVWSTEQDMWITGKPYTD